MYKKFYPKETIKPRYCRHGCKCPDCGRYLEAEEHGAHYCLGCQDYKLINCPGWAIHAKREA